MRKFLPTLLLTIVLFGCSKQDLEIEDLDIIYIDPTERGVFYYHNASNPSMGWEVRDNGELYSVCYHGEKVAIKSERKIWKVFIMSLSSKKEIPVNGDTFSCKVPLDKKSTFRIYYEPKY